MKNRSPEFDAHIAEAAPFAQPILKKIRALFHKACPQIEETMKWHFPHFEYKGIVARLGAFKWHVSFGFWKGNLLTDRHSLFAASEKPEMTWARITDISQLPSDKVLLEYIREAIALNEKGVKPPAEKKRRRKKELPVPDDLARALKKNKKVRETFESFSPSNKRDYVEWITEAKQDETRARRLATAIEWMAEGKPRNWKYMKKKRPNV